MKREDVVFDEPSGHGRGTADAAVWAMPAVAVLLAGQRRDQPVSKAAFNQLCRANIRGSMKPRQPASSPRLNNPLMMASARKLPSHFAKDATA